MVNSNNESYEFYNKFVEEANKIHNNRYSYPQKSYKFKSEKIEIKCKEHGVFFQSGGKHLQGQGCKRCVKKLLSYEEFLEKSILTHGNKYIYDKSSFTMATESVKITCPIHGFFIQKAYKHYNGQGCKKCGDIKRINQQSMSFDEFLLKAKETHGERYIYHEETYERGGLKTKITCRIHGFFWQQASMHIVNKHNCHKCAYITSARKAAKISRIPFNIFLSRVSEVFNNKYIYLSEDYVSMNKIVKVTCPDHGVFSILAAEHVKGYGCKKCSFARSRPERLIRKILLENEINFEEQFRHFSLKSPIGGGLSFDFLLIDFNTIIEYDGRHHFEAAFGSTIEKATEVFNRTVANDTIKNAWAKENNYKLIRLSNERTLKSDLFLSLNRLSRNKITDISEE